MREGEAPVAVVAENRGLGSAECNVRRDFGSGKSVALGIRKT